MDKRKTLAAALLTLALLAPCALAELPKDEPITYGAPELDQSAVSAHLDEAPALDESAVPEGTMPETATITIGGGSVRPGEKNPINSFTVQTVSDIRFESPYEPAVVDATNPDGSTVITQYTLRVSVAELERQIGRNGYTEEQYQQIRKQQGFDPETSYIELAATKGIAPGTMVQALTLGALPDGSVLGAGDYDAEMVITAYDSVTHKRSMLNSVVKVKVQVLSEQVAVAFDESGTGQIHAYNPATQGGEVKFESLISQKALVDGCGEPHRTEAELEAQNSSAAFDPAYEFIPLYESEPVAPGESLDADIQLSPLPDGQKLPKGNYSAWMARYTYDESTQLWQLQDARVELKLSVQ